jgi:peptidoglycan/LPS O-acetylase OafA/YrhL
VTSLNVSRRSLSLLIYSVALLVHHLGYRALLPELLTQMMYVHNFTSLDSVNFVTWSLEVEVQFYILVPLLGCLYAIRSAVVRRGVMVCLLLASMYVHMLTQSKASLNLPGQLQFFMVGFLLADLRAGRTESTIKAWWDAVGVSAWALLFLLPGRVSLLVLPALILLACLRAGDSSGVTYAMDRSYRGNVLFVLPDAHADNFDRLQTVPEANRARELHAVSPDSDRSFGTMRLFALHRLLRHHREAMYGPQLAS